MTIKTLGIDLGKRCFHVFGADDYGKTIVKKQFSRSKLITYLSTLEPCVIGFEACAGSHYWARKVKELGHTPKLMPGQFVKPFVKSNKNDFLDAEAIWEAVQRPTMRFVTERTEEQQALGCLVKLRNNLVGQRTSVINQVHGFLLEFGVEYPKGRKTVLKLMDIISKNTTVIPGTLKLVLYRLYEETCYLRDTVDELEREMEQRLKQDERGQKLLEIPGVGVNTAACLIAWVGDAKHFKSGRALAAWIGLVPKQKSTGGKQVLQGIGKRAHTLLRFNLIHGARSALQWYGDKPSAWKEWAEKLVKEKPKPKVVVALANKMARMIWVVLNRNELYKALPNRCQLPC